MTPLHDTVIFKEHRMNDKQNPPPTDAEALALCKALMRAPNSAKYINAISKQGYTALGGAASLGFVNTARFLLECKANPNTSLFPGFEPAALQHALLRGSLPIAKMMVAAGACTHPIFCRDQLVSISHLPLLKQKELEVRSAAELTAWCRSVEQPAVEHCSTCGMDSSAEAKTKHAERQARMQSEMAQSCHAKCSNPKCKVVHECEKHHVTPLHLKKCSRCLKVAYCSVDCQKEHWRNGHKAVCTSAAAARASGKA